MKNPRREALLIEAGFYACINDCNMVLVLIKPEECNGVTGILLKAVHLSTGCEEPSRLIGIGCVITASRNSDVYNKVMELDADSVEYALRDNELIIAVVDCDELLKTRKWRECLDHSASYTCINDYKELSDTLRAM